MSLEIIVPIDNRTQERYRFWLFNEWDKLEAVLDVYDYMTRKTHRHKFVSVSKYNRLDNTHSMDINSIVIPAAVIKQVKEEVIKMLVVKK